ncbi:MAG: YraN family protein [Prevotellaceae bacterium]|nr:YraN family protein [Candidatus Minthosoma caballi]
MNNRSIYTLGLNGLSSECFISIIKSFRIDCIVDIRDTHIANLPGFYSQKAIQQYLKDSSIHYLPFCDSFGIALPHVLNKKGKIIYSKYIKDEHYLNAFKRLQNGINKGFIILIIDNENQHKKSIRYSVIGKFLSNQGISVYHLSSNGHSYSQQEVDEQIKLQKEKRNQDNKNAKELGINGEELAALYLQQNGFIILDHNWNLHYGCELDIVARKDNVIHFVEVKTRSSDKYGAPQQAINKKKLANIHKAVREYRYKYFLTNLEFSIDSIAIVYKSEEDYQLNFYEHIGHPITKNFNTPYKNHGL